MIDHPVTSEALLHAMRRIQDFSTVQSGEEWGEQLQALLVLRESLGLDDELLTQFDLWATSFLGDDELSVPMMMGLMIGLIAADYAAATA